MRRPIAALALLLLAACGQAPGSTNMPETSIATDPAATLTFNPSAASLKVGESLDVQVLLDLKGRSSQTFQAEITFDPAVVEVVDANTEVRGIQVGLGMYETPIINEVLEGRIRLVGYSLTPGKEATGTGTLATITLRGRSAGATTMAFDRAEGPVANTKIIAKGESTDLLASAGTATVTVTN